MSVVAHFWVAVVMLFVIGVSSIMLVASCNTALQLAAPDALRGRVMSLTRSSSAGPSPRLRSWWAGSRARVRVHSPISAPGVSGVAALVLITLWWRSVPGDSAGGLCYLVAADTITWTGGFR